MNAPSVDIKTLLDGESSFGLTFATNLFVGREPELPDEVTTIFDTPGRGPELFISNDGFKWEHVAFQIRYRDRDYRDGYARAEAIGDYLHGRAHEDIGGTRYELIQSAGSLTLLDWDDNERVRFVQNFTAIRKSST